MLCNGLARGTCCRTAWQSAGKARARLWSRCLAGPRCWALPWRPHRPGSSSPPALPSPLPCRPRRWRQSAAAWRWASPRTLTALTTCGGCRGPPLAPGAAQRRRQRQQQQQRTVRARRAAGLAAAAACGRARAARRARASARAASAAAARAAAGAAARSAAAAAAAVAGRRARPLLARRSGTAGTGAGRRTASCLRLCLPSCRRPTTRTPTRTPSRCSRGSSTS